MTQLAILALSSAGVTITVAVCMFVMGRRAADAERRAGASDTKVALLDGKLLSCTQSAERRKAVAIEGEATIVALTEMINDVSQDLDPAGARARLHAKWFAFHASKTAGTAASGGAIVVHDQPTVTAGPDGLIDPFAK